jgi:glutaredoxin
MKVKVFSMKGCPHCDNLKNLLKENNINFTELLPKWGNSSVKLKINEKIIIEKYKFWYV